MTNSCKATSQYGTSCEANQLLCNTYLLFATGCFEARCPLSPDYTPVSGGNVKAENVDISWSIHNGNIPKMLISWSQSLPGNSQHTA